MASNFIDEIVIQNSLSEYYSENPALINEILDKAKLLKGLEFKEVAALIAIKSPALVQKLFDTAKHVKEMIYGKRLVILPHYIFLIFVLITVYIVLFALLIKA